MERRLAEVHSATRSQDHVKRQRWLAEFFSKSGVELLGIRIDEFRNTHMSWIAMQRAGADKNGVSAAPQESHHELVVGAFAADRSAARLPGYAEGHDAVHRLDEVADHIRPIARRPEAETAPVELFQLGR